jgi:DNA-binding MarR family transcriptional regulator
MLTTRVLDDHRNGYNQGMRERLLSETAAIYGRSTRVLDPLRMQVWDQLGISQPQLRILFRVRARPGIDLRSLAADLEISPSAASQQVERLVERGLISRAADSDDRRRLSLELTDLGRDATRAMSEATHGYLIEVLSEFSDDELAELHRLLEKVMESAAAHPRTQLFEPKDHDLETSLRRLQYRQT